MAVPAFATYLRRRRAALSPEDAGLPSTGVRRVPGLRRDEIAHLVGVSTDYYTRLEQGRVGRPSDSVLDSLARTLQLNRAEHAHLIDLAGPPRRRRTATPATVPVLRPALAMLATSIVAYPAVIMNRRTDVLAWNPLAAALIADFDALPATGRNMARLLFLHPHANDRHADWDRSARDTVGILRMAAGRDPLDRGLISLVGELSTRSEPFRVLWSEHHVHEKTHGSKQFRHPDTGVIDLTYETLHVPEPDDLMLVAYTAEPDSPAADALALLGSLLTSRAPAADRVAQFGE